MWNKADIRAVLLSCETSIAPFLHCLQNVVNWYFNNYRRSFRLGRRAEGSWISAKIATNSVTKANTCSRKPQGLCQNIFTACRRRRPRPLFPNGEVTTKHHEVQEVTSCSRFKFPCATQISAYGCYSRDYTAAIQRNKPVICNTTMFRGLTKVESDGQGNGTIGFHFHA